MIETFVRCPGCGHRISFDEEAWSPDEALEAHMASYCARPDEQVLARARA